MSEGDATREILEKVAAGEMDPTTAAQLLDETTGAGSEEQPAVTESGTLEGATLPAASEVTRITVRATSRRVRIVGDPGVATVAVEGPHTLRREGATLLVTGETEIVRADDAFTLLVGGRWREVADRVQHGLARDLELKVRVRPDLAVGVEVIAGSLHVDGARALDHVRVTAGSCRIHDVEGPVDLLVQAGSAQVDMVQTQGHSWLRCESGSLQLTLEEGTDAEVRSDVQMGRLTLEPERRGRDRHGEIVVGLGGSQIDVEAVMGAVVLRTPDRGDAR
ncbi:hypothetical protein EF847_18370 [Actinobacteria bacterium YIM 96077]|uniref:Adhesin domain-containing protein n=1 Tax=Phytoactinopolyspora halophila TaxID=1981511 RepID=A0A329QKI0_9ACTN|nr:hypothetical protein [Phytoactinopolyspora halophila]AYY14365.1 hypothetical protein EF847_18370 [Actinobacteria bacterium YIM 96077]RAW11912.1 hypothetical protein DPM12_15750 [Phytoactinopolyspora halophila]